MRIRPLAREDVPAALRLSTQAGWNQIGADWRRLLDSAPDGCFAGWVGGELVATSTVVAYGGAVSWIGMVLVEESHRRNGYGSRLFERALARALDRGVPLVGLDATDAGRAVYRGYDFVDAAPIERWAGHLPLGESPASVERVSASDADRILAADRAAAGVDRGEFLSALLAEPGTTGLAVRRGDRVAGYALLRPGRTSSHVGPVIADDDEALRELLAAAGAELDGRRVLIDALGDRETRDDGGLGRPAIEETLETHGFERRRRLTRMVHERDEPALFGEAVVAAAGFELG